VVLREKVAGSKSSNQSANLVSLNQKYQEWCKLLRALIVALQKHCDAITALRDSRAAVRYLHKSIEYGACFLLLLGGLDWTADLLDQIGPGRWKWLVGVIYSSYGPDTREEHRRRRARLLLLFSHLFSSMISLQN